MKNNDWLIIIATAAYSYLFYEQNPGLNFLLFNFILMMLLVIRDPRVLTHAAWIAAAAGSIISSFFVFWWGTALPVWANLFSLLVLAGLSFNAQTSILVAYCNACFSLLAATPISMVRILSRPAPTDEKNKSIFEKSLLFIIPLVITTVFFFLYRAANPIFEQLTNKINFDFISADWVLFTVVGFILMYGFFRHSVISWLTGADHAADNNLRTLTIEEHLQSSLGQMLTVPNEVLTGSVLFALLNLLLLSVNGLDIFYMWIVQKIPQGISVAQYLHEGTNTLIVSIILAIAIILFIFRGYLNFFENNKWLKLLCYGWIAQNILLVVTTANRNWWAIESSGLTRKRIGVYVYLLLCIIGLVTTYWKVAQRKSNWFLFRKNSWAFYGVFIVSCFFNWDNMIVRYNCVHFKSNDLPYIDKFYQTQLSHTCLASLFEFYSIEKGESSNDKRIFTPEVVRSMFYSYLILKEQDKTAQWQSYSVSKKQNLHAVEEMIRKGEVEAPPSGLNPRYPE